MEKQMRLFNVSVPEEKLRNKRRKPLFCVQIISEKKKIFVFWERAWRKSRAKELAAIEYNDMCGYDRETPVKFGKVKEIKGGN